MDLSAERPQPRLAAGRARALGLPTRGTTGPNRLRRLDRWIVAELGPQLRLTEHPFVEGYWFRDRNQ